MVENHPAMEIDPEAAPLKLHEWNGTLLRETPLLRFKPDVDPDTVDFETGYGAAALYSWGVFERLQAAGVIPAETRFQVCLPTPASSAYMYVSPNAHEAYLRVYERALLKALGQILDGIPHDRLALQWDVCQEVLIFEDYFPWRPDDYKGWIAALLARLGNQVPEPVELGYHLCYGTPRDEHLVMPKDTAVAVEIADGFMAGLTRSLQWLHLPVPQDRTDGDYYVPLKDSGVALRHPALPWPDPPRRRDRRPGPHRTGQNRRARVRHRRRMRLGPRRPGPRTGVAGKPP